MKDDFCCLHFGLFTSAPADVFEFPRHGCVQTDRIKACQSSALSQLCFQQLTETFHVIQARL